MAHNVQPLMPSTVLSPQNQPVGNPSVGQRFPVRMPMLVAPTQLYRMPRSNLPTMNTIYPSQPTVIRPNIAAGKYSQI